jgi:hypothetical protein
MVIVVEVDNLIDKAIIKAFKKAERGMLTRKAIIQIVKTWIAARVPPTLFPHTQIQLKSFVF